jgi:hypothetical protein
MLPVGKEALLCHAACREAASSAPQLRVYDSNMLRVSLGSACLIRRLIKHVQASRLDSLAELDIKFFMSPSYAIINARTLLFSEHSVRRAYGAIKMLRITAAPVARRYLSECPTFDFPVEWGLYAAPPLLPAPTPLQELLI